MPPAADQHDDDGRLVAEQGRRIEQRLESLRLSQIAGIAHEEAAIETELAREGVRGGHRLERGRVDEVRDHDDSVGGHALLEQPLSHAIGDHDDPRGPRVDEPLQREQQPDEPRPPHGAEVDGDVGIELLHVVDERGAMPPPQQPCGDADRQRRRRRDDDVDAAQRDDADHQAERMEQAPRGEPLRHRRRLAGHDGVPHLGVTEAAARDEATPGARAAAGAPRPRGPDCSAAWSSAPRPGAPACARSTARSPMICAVDTLSGGNTSESTRTCANVRRRPPAPTPCTRAGRRRARRPAAKSSASRACVRSARL